MNAVIIMKTKMSNEQKKNKNKKNSPFLSCDMTKHWYFASSVFEAFFFFQQKYQCINAIHMIQGFRIHLGVKLFFLLLYPGLSVPASVAQLDACQTGDHEVEGSTPAGSAASMRLIMKYFLRWFFPFRWFKKDSCQFLGKECAQYWLTAK